MQFRTCDIITRDIITDTLSTCHIKDAVRCRTSCRKKYTLTYTWHTDPHTHTHTHLDPIHITTHTRHSAQLPSPRHTHTPIRTPPHTYAGMHSHTEQFKVHWFCVFRVFVTVNTGIEVANVLLSLP